MKAINKFFYTLLALATVGMVGCQNAETFEPGAPEVEGCYDVYFPDANTLETQGPIGAVELDPTEPTEFTYTAYRNNTDDEIVVPIKVVTNTENKFTVSELKFAEGEDVAQFKVNLLESEIGVKYTLSLSIDDPQYVKQYESKNSNALSLNVTRVKWNDVGVCTYTDDLISGWWGVPLSTVLNAKVQVRADSIKADAFAAALDGTGSDAGLAGIYRMVNPYSDWASTPVGGLELYDANVIINAQNINEVYIPLQEVGVKINGGAVMIYSGVAWAIDNDKSIDPAEYGCIKGGMIQFPVDALLGCPGGTYAGNNTYYANRNGGWTLTIAPKLGKYSLVLPEGYEDGDFAFEEVALPEGAHFYSESQAAVYEPILEKGKPAVNTDDADRAFVEQYGFLYRLVDPYAVDFPIYFGAKLDGTVTLHPDFAEQATGLVQNGYDVMMAIDAAASKFDPETGLLTLVAEFYTYQGDYIIPYGIYKEVISVEAPNFPVAPALDLKSDFNYKAVFTDKFTSTYQAAEWEATLEKGTSLKTNGADAFKAAYGTAYRIPNAYKAGYDIYFAANDKGEVTIPAGYELQATGTSIYGQPAFIKIKKGTMANNGVTLTVAICNAEGKAIMPYACTESLITYNWIDVQTGDYYSVLFGDEATQQIIPFTGRQLQHAEGTNIYRIVNWLDFGGDFMFTWDKDTNKCSIIGMPVTGMPADKFGGFGNVCVCDALTILDWFGVSTNWATAEKNGYTQPYFDPQTKEFVFEIFYIFPDMGVGYMLNDMDGLPVPFTEAFVLSGEITEAKWVQVGTGSYSAPIFQDQDGNPFVAPGRVLENKENTNSYRINDWLYSEVEGITLPFTVEANNKINIQGIVDSGLPSSIFGNYQTNAYVCDVLTLYTKLLGQSVTWEDLIKQYGESIQPSYNPEAKTYTFVVSYVFPADGVIVDNSFFKETYTIDQSASTSEASVRKISSERIAIKGDLEGKMTTKKALSYRVRQSSVDNKMFQTEAKAAPAKRPIFSAKNIISKF